MKHSTIIKIIDLLSFISLTLMISTGTLLRFTLPPRSGGDEVWGFTRHDWGNFHYYISLTFLLLMTAHLFTHIKYIKSVITGKASTEKSYRIAIGVVGIITLIALAFSPVTSPVTDVQKGQQKFHQSR